MPNISDEELKKISEGLTKAVDSERRGRAVLTAIGPALLDALEPILGAIAETIAQIPEQVEQAISKVKINVEQPTIPPAEVTVNVPEVKVPKAEVEVRIPEQPTPNYTFKVPEIKVPKANVTVKVPKSDNKEVIKAIESVTKAVTEQKPASFEMPEYTRKNPMPVLMTDLKGNPMQPFTSSSSSIDRKKGLHIDEYDYVALVESDNQDIYTFKKGGKAVAGITIVYADSTKATISTVTRT